MSKLFYFRLAATNMKKNARMYVPYLFTCIGTVMMYYIIHALTQNQSLKESYGGSAAVSLLNTGSGVIGIFAVIFLFYTNGFLIKQRKREFGLFNILGMEKRHIAKIIIVETLYTAVVSMALGLGMGVLLSKLVELFLFRLLHFQIHMGIELSPIAMGKSLVLFAGIFLLILLNNLRQIQLSKPIELLKGSNVGEREPKAKWLLALIGFLCLGGGYYISLTTESPLEAVTLFLVAIVLVMIGTYCLFTAGTIVVLKMMKKNKRFYYKTKHFTSISGMMYRMKQNAAGLANICILSTGVLIMLSTTCSMYAGMDNLLRNRFPRNIQVKGTALSEKQIEEVDQAVAQVEKERGLKLKDTVNYRYMSLMVLENEDGFYVEEEGMSSGQASDLVQLVCIPLKDFNRLSKTQETLERGQVLLYEANGHLEGEQIRLEKKEYQVKERIEELFTFTDQSDSLTDTFYLIVPDADTVYEMLREGLDVQEEIQDFDYYYGFDLEESAQVQKEVTEQLNALTENKGFACYVEGAEESRNSFYGLYGSMLFLGIFLGLLFVMATVLIIYYKQITEGYEDKERFHIMQKVGMSRREVKASIRSQVLTVFFLPLVMACIHTAFAYPVVKKILQLMNLTNTVIFIQTTVVTVAAFAVFYVFVYSLTAKAYEKIVSA